MNPLSMAISLFYMELRVSFMSDSSCFAACCGLAGARSMPEFLACYLFLTLTTMIRCTVCVRILNGNVLLPHPLRGLGWVWWFCDLRSKEIRWNKLHAGSPLLEAVLSFIHERCDRKNLSSLTGLSDFFDSGFPPHLSMAFEVELNQDVITGTW